MKLLGSLQPTRRGSPRPGKAPICPLCMSTAMATASAIANQNNWAVLASPGRRLARFPLRRVTDGGHGLGRSRAAWSPVLASLCFEEMLAQVAREADDGDRDAVVLERPSCPGPRARQERGCSQRVAQAQDELRPRVDGGGYSGQLESVGKDLVALRALWGPLMGPALGQD